MIGYEGALTGICCTGSGQADGIGTRLGGWAGNYGLRVYFTFIGPRKSVADEGAIAKVTIFEGIAIVVRLAIAGDGCPGALASLALVGNGAWVAVVAVGKVVLEMATTGAVTGVVGARVIIIADNGIANADASLAIVRCGAGVAILAFALVEELVGASSFPVAGIGGTLVAVVTEVDEVATYFIWFVLEAVAVVIQSVASFC